jgi:hypothetical protein
VIPLISKYVALDISMEMLKKAKHNLSEFINNDNENKP